MYDNLKGFHLQVGSQMIRGISGGQKKRVTTGEMIAGPKRTLFMVSHVFWHENQSLAFAK